MKIFEEKAVNYRYYIGAETKVDGVMKLNVKTGYFKTRKEAEKRLKELEQCLENLSRLGCDTKEI